MGEHIGFAIFLWATSTPGNIVMLIFLQTGMKLYDQIEVIPLYLTSSLVFMTISGMVILNEVALYTFGQLVGIFFGIVFCILGIVIMNFKLTSTNLKEGVEQTLIDETEFKKKLISEVIETHQTTETTLETSN